MAEQTELAISPREVMGKATKRLRKAGIIPANIFGHQEEPQAVQIDAIAFDQLVRGHHATGIIALRQPGDGATQTALIRHVQRDPRSGKILHIDFFRVNLNERISSKIPLHFVGEAPAVKNEGGVLLHLLDALEVECEAKDLVEYIEVDVTPLTEIDSVIHAEDVKLPENYTLLTDPKEAIAKVAATRAEVAEEAAETTEAAPAPATPEAQQAGSQE
ncbi:MAG TPA: 50S ribosomal protein L25 [Ktedonobacteraceae bacterium]|jgi:large subunit ribosomal protein L25|nr:50S ribosomal protein L25 [Ktedonobacteraceae bacterium]